MFEVDLDLSSVEEAAERALGELDRQLDSALDLGAEAVAADARKTTAFVDRSGALRASTMSAGVEGSFSGNDLHADVTYAAVSEGGFPYGIAINSGSRPHEIRARRRKRLRIPVSDGFVFPEVVQHPGTAATHFADDALEARIPFIVKTLERAADLAFRKAGFE